MQDPSVEGRLRPRHAIRTMLRTPLLALLLAMACETTAIAHGVAAGDRGHIQEITGVNLIALMCLVAKHMATGNDHILFLLGVYFNVGINSYIIDAIIGLSVVYKALDNMGAALEMRSPESCRNSDGWRSRRSR